MKYVRIKKELKNSAKIHLDVLFDSSSLSNPKDHSLDRAFGVEKVDKCPITSKTRVHLLDFEGMNVVGWVFEDFTETING